MRRHLFIRLFTGHYFDKVFTIGMNSPKKKINDNWLKPSKCTSCQNCSTKDCKAKEKVMHLAKYLGKAFNCPVWCCTVNIAQGVSLISATATYQ